MKNLKFNTVVLGGGPAGYVAGIKLGQLGIKATVIEDIRVGGVCLNRGCIPSKVLISASRRYSDAKNGENFGIVGGENLSFNLSKLMEYKAKTVKKLTSGVASLLKYNKTQILNGRGIFIDKHHIKVVTQDEEINVEFENALIATGSVAKYFPGAEPDGKTVISSDDALNLNEIPSSLIVIGGGVIGLELGSFYASVGSEVTVIEAMDQIMPGTTPSLVKILMRSLKKKGIKIYTSSKVKKINRNSSLSSVIFENSKGEQEISAEKILVSIGRKPNLEGSGLENLGFDVKAPYLKVDEYLRTSIPNIYAAGDITGNPLLAHRASAQAEIAVQNIAGMQKTFNPFAIPAVSYTDPEVATVGISSEQAKKQNIEYKTGKFKFAASGRAMASGHTDGYLEIIVDKKDEVIGVEIVGPEASELISEGIIAVENHLKIYDLADAIHAHPTLGEVMMEAAKDVHSEAIHQIPTKK